MHELFYIIKNNLKKELVILWIFSTLAGFTLIALGIKHKLPLGIGDFSFISALALCVALYRPRWAFFLLVSFIPLENIILVSGFLPIQLRPYQYIEVILTIAVIILWISKRLNFKLLRPNWLDWLVFSLLPLSFLSLVNSPNRNISFKNNLILFSFIVLYYLIRNFVRNRKDLSKTAFFFIGSDLVVLGYGFYQVLADRIGARSFEVMFGRPNSTFTEPDWLGIYLCFSLAVLLSLIFYFTPHNHKLIISKKYILIILNILVFLNITLVILTLSRSAWIGTAIITIFWLLFNLYEKNKEHMIIFTPVKFGREFLTIILIGILSAASIYFGKLSKFDIFDRARSTATNEQKITIACEDNSNIPSIVSNTDDLAFYGCQHINLENIDYYKARGKYVTTIFRKDPNVMTRSQVYRKSFEIIREHPIVGVGFGTITQKLGSDERGAGLNESNIFLQIWTGTGILGLAVFIIILVYLFMHAFRRISPVCPLNKVIGCSMISDDFEKTLNIFLVLGIIGVFVPNLFNAGLFLGTIWLGLGIFLSAIKLQDTNL